LDHNVLTINAKGQEGAQKMQIWASCFQKNEKNALWFWDPRPNDVIQGSCTCPNCDVTHKKFQTQKYLIM